MEVVDLNMRAPYFYPAEQPTRLWILESESLSVVSFPFGRLAYPVRLAGNCFAFCPEVKVTVCFGRESIVGANRVASKPGGLNISE